MSGFEKSFLGWVAVLAVASAILLASPFIPWQQLLSDQGLAAWVQAIGSIAAIVAAFIVGSTQLQAARSLENDRQALIDRRRLAVVDSVAMRIAMWCEAVQEAYDENPKQNQPLVTRALNMHELGDCRQILAAIDPFELPDASLVTMMGALISTIDRVDRRMQSAKQEARSTEIPPETIMEWAMKRELADLGDHGRKLSTQCRQLSQAAPLPHVA